MHQGWGRGIGAWPRCAVEQNFLILGDNRPNIRHPIVALRGMGCVNARIACYLAVTAPGLSLVFGDSSMNDEPSALGVGIPQAIVPKHHNASVFQAYQCRR